MNKKVRIALLIIDFILLVLFVAFVPQLLHDIVGSDVVEYENWFGDITNPIEYCFGAGCWEITIVVIKTICFVVGQCFVLKGQKGKRIWTAVYHIAIGVLGLAYIFKYADGDSFLYLIQCLTSNGS